MTFLEPAYPSRRALLLGLAASVPVLLYQGKFAPTKGVELLVEAMKHVTHPGAVLVLLGEGPLESALREAVADGGLAGRVLFHASVPGKVLHAWTRDATIGLYAVAAEGVPLDTVEQAMDKVVRELREKGATQAELDRAKKQFIAEFVYESDSQEAIARRYGSGLALGLTVAQIDSWPEEIAKVTLADLKQKLEREEGSDG